ncbi:counting factor associated protein D-like [Dendronephthya gigantea]|uniref:counting factor associated protein D-like n=1 Tax=Dendronephthya gigantea TaxID=151771 RepID=UPI00106CA86A|nr:counting factor associated protein D-like [Dendronephthya gigantea]
MLQKRTDGRSKRFKLAWVALLSVVVVIGFCLEIKKYILGTTRVELKRYAIVGEFDPSYDKLFPRNYHATGLLTLPYDNIVEPFEAWYAGERNMSRIDYYYGMDKTIQRGDMDDHGLLFKIIPKHKDPAPSKTFFRSCWIRRVPSWDPIQGQSVIPTNLSEFKLQGVEIYKGQPCRKYVRKIVEYNKTNTYTLFVTDNEPHIPVKYEMFGYDDLLTSHYDHYILDYITFSPWAFNFSIFKIPADTWCGKKARKIKSRYFVNPMAEFVHFHHSQDQETEKHFKKFKKLHLKDYKHHHENERRKHIFKHNLRFINSRNRRNTAYTLSVNHLSDLTEEEMESHRGMLSDDENDEEEGSLNEKEKKRILNLMHDKHFDKLPKTLDWRDYGAVTPVSSQGLCGSCWTFSIAAPIEAHYFFQTGKMTEISKQQIMDCSWGSGNHGCRGGLPAKALAWAVRNGVATKKSYGPYLGQEAYCHCGQDENCTVIDNAKDFYRVRPNTVKTLKLALAKYGPISCSINADAKTLRFYSKGVYNDPENSKKRNNHAVVCIGYGIEDNKEPYWILKNTWGPLWGDNGYIKISQKGNIANIHGGQLLTIKKDNKIPDFPYQSLKKVKRREKLYNNLASISV